MTTKLKDSIIVLVRIKNQLLNVKEGVSFLVEQKMAEYNSTWDNEKIAHLNTAMFGLMHYSFIWYASFIDEYNKYFTSKDLIEKDRIKSVKRICKNHFAGIREIFGDVKEARNRVLAHGYRNKDIPLTKDEINQYHDQLIRFETLDPFIKLSTTLSLIIEEIEKEFGVIDESEIALQ